MRCPYCGEYTKTISKVGWWENANLGYCPKTKRYFIEIYSSTTNVEGITSGIGSFFEIGKSDYDNLSKEESKIPNSLDRLGLNWKHIKTVKYDYDL